MKRVYILVLILSLLIAGCKATSDNSPASETVVNMEQTDENQQITEVPVTEAPATIDYPYSRKPGAADWSFMKKQYTWLYSLLRG